MRHGLAVAADFQTTDASRWLTERGRDLVALASHALVAELQTTGRHIDRIVCSPLVRTVQTAERVATGLGYTGEIQTLHSLQSEAPSQQGLEALLEFAPDTVLAVTHEPIVSSMSSLLSGSIPSSFRPGYQPSEVRRFDESLPPWRHRP